MSQVHLLPPEIISKIAAGEVIERPASVVKELIENSLDAGTKSIDISLKQAGKTYISLKDTGTGIEPDDIEKIFLRHSTSKIQNMDDLFAIRSLGFRGEALYSIAAISDITLRSKTKSNDTGWEIHIRGGEKINLHPVSMAEGTEIEIRELFFNTPARKKFLKTDTAELQQVLNIFLPYTLLYPEKGFRLAHNDTTIIDLPPDQNHIGRIKKALNLKPEHIMETKNDFQDNNISLHLILGDINIQRSRKDMQFIFVNARPVQNRSISFHINQIYKLLFPTEIYPFFAIYLDTDPENLDVNIHPTKREVKIKNEAVIAPLLRTMCEQTLMSRGKAKEMEKIIFTPNTTKVKSPQKNYNTSTEQQITFMQETAPATLKQGDLRNKLSFARYVGTFQKKYLFFESGQSLLVLDQHAAQERVNYEQFIGQIKSGSMEIQRLVSPFVIQLSPQEKLAWENLKDTLTKIGLETTPWDNENIALHTHPQLIKNPEIALRSILSEKDNLRFDADTVARRACRSSLMAGDKMSFEEIEHLRKKLLKCKDPFICPHGRPTVIEIKDATLEKQFLRQ